jgi:hypothetical protein
MKNVSRKKRLALIMGALVVLTLAMGVFVYAEDDTPDPPVGFVAPINTMLNM